MKKRGSAARSRSRRPAKRSTRKGGVLAALWQLFAALFNRSEPPAGGGGGGGGGGSTRRPPPPRRRWEDDELDRDEFGQWKRDDRGDEAELDLWVADRGTLGGGGNEWADQAASTVDHESTKGRDDG